MTTHVFFEVVQILLRVMGEFVANDHEEQDGLLRVSVLDGGAEHFVALGQDEVVGQGQQLTEGVMSVQDAEHLAQAKVLRLSENTHQHILPF